MGTGKKRIEIKKVDNMKYRRVTFTRRRNGLFKKAAELSGITGCRVCVLTFSPSVLTPFLYGDLSLLEAAAAATLSNASPNFEIENCSVSVGDGNLKSSLVLGEASDCKDSCFTEYETVAAQKSSPNLSCPNSEIGNCGHDNLKSCLGLGEADDYKDSCFTEDEPVDVDAANASCSNVNDMMMMNWQCNTDCIVNDDAFPCSSNSSAMFELSCADYGITSSTSAGDNMGDDDVYAGVMGDLVNLDAVTSSGFSNYEIASCSNYPSVGNNMGGACGDDKDSSFMDDVYAGLTGDIVNLDAVIGSISNYEIATCSNCPSVGDNMGVCGDDKDSGFTDDVFAGLTGDIVNLDAVTGSSISNYEIASCSNNPSVGADLSFMDDDVFAGLVGYDNEDLVGAVTSSSNVRMLMDSNVNALNTVPCSSSSATLDYEHYNYDSAANYMSTSTGHNENDRSLLGFRDVTDFGEKMACEAAAAAAAAGDMISELYSEDSFIILP